MAFSQYSLDTVVSKPAIDWNLYLKPGQQCDDDRFIGDIGNPMRIFLPWQKIYAACQAFWRRRHPASWYAVVFSGSKIRQQPRVACIVDFADRWLFQIARCGRYTQLNIAG